MWSEDGVPEALRFLDGADEIQRPPTAPQPFDVVVAVDTAARCRGGESLLRAIAPGAFLINIDHHGTNDAYGDLNHIDPCSPATGQILFDLLTETVMPMSPTIATALFVAIATDTGFFQYSGTTARTHEIAASLIRAGVNAPHVASALNDHAPRRRFELMRVFLDHAQFENKGQVAWSSILLSDLESTGANGEDVEGLINLIRGVEGVKVAVIFEELADRKVRVSMRSKSPSVDVSAICMRLGGGGHPAAAGARLRGEIDEVRARVLNAVNDEIAK
jgi:phosphoesterase RecJ-like protein